MKTIDPTLVLKVELSGYLEEQSDADSYDIFSAFNADRY